VVGGVHLLSKSIEFVGLGLSHYCGDPQRVCPLDGFIGIQRRPVAAVLSFVAAHRDSLPHGVPAQ